MNDAKNVEHKERTRSMIVECLLNCQSNGTGALVENGVL